MRIPGIEFDKEYFEMTLSKPWVFVFIAETFFVAAFLIEAVVGLF
jgi:hypothetical protein